MNASEHSLTPENVPPAGSFAEVAALINLQLQEAVVVNAANERYRYFLLGSRSDASHYLAVFCVASSVEPLGVPAAERIRLAVPIERPDVAMPISALGQGADYFYMSYLTSRDRVGELRVNPRVLARQFGRRAPVQDFTRKLLTYTVVPMRKRDPNSA